MLTREDFSRWIGAASRLLDGATGTCLFAAGMPRGSRMEKWCLSHPDALRQLQARYVQAGSEMLYAPTLRAQPLPLSASELDAQTERVNERLVALTREAAAHCLVAGTLTTLKGWMDTSSETSLPDMIRQYRRQIRGLVAGGADLLVAETLLSSLDGIAVLEAAEKEHAETVICSFSLRQDGALRSGEDAAPALRALLSRGAAMVGLNCVPADENLCCLAETFSSLHRPFLLKPNAGQPVPSADGSRVYPVRDDAFAARLLSCVSRGARLIGGCCGTTPDTISAVRKALSDGCA